MTRRIAGIKDTGSLMCTEANTRLSSAEIESSGNVSSGSQDTTRSILSSVRPVSFNACQRVTSGGTVTMSLPIRFICPAVYLIARTGSLGKWREEAHFCEQEAFSPKETSATHSCYRRDRQCSSATSPTPGGGRS